MAVVQSVDQVHVPRTAASGAYCQCARHVRFRPSGERSRFLVAHADPFNVLAFANLFQQAIERIANHTVNPFYSSCDQRLDNDLSY
jgi:hypothetical protein